MFGKRIYQQALLYFFFAFVTSCNQNAQPPKKEKEEASQPSITKPGASGTDSLEVTSPTVVLFAPDSLQLEKIKAITEDGVFKSMTHESEFQFYTVRMYLKKNRPDLKLLDARNARYIVFVKADKKKEIIDLDKISDAWGMYVFDPKKEPQIADMMSVDTEIPRYFSK